MSSVAVLALGGFRVVVLMFDSGLPNRLLRYHTVHKRSIIQRSRRLKSSRPNQKAAPSMICPIIRPAPRREPCILNQSICNNTSHIFSYRESLVLQQSQYHPKFVIVQLYRGKREDTGVPESLVEFIASALLQEGHVKSVSEV